ncbi:hypothetical protein [Sinorhizobium medicae]
MVEKPAQFRVETNSWPAVLRDELAAAYAGERTVDAFMSRVGTVWPRPFIDTGTGKGKFRAWRKTDLDKVINPEAVAAGGDPEAL